MAIFPGTAGDDTYPGTPDNDQITGLAGYDFLRGAAGNDTIDGGDDDDDLYGDAGNDTITGGNGNDYIQGGLGLDTLDGGAGIDVADYTTFNGDAVYNLTTGSANLIGAFTETMLNFEHIYTGGGNDVITGTAGNNFLSSNVGNDTIDGGAGDDIIYSDAGNDYIQGGLGADYLDGSNGNDTIYGGSGNDTIGGGAGDDYIQGGLGQDYLDGGDGTNDTVDYTTFNGDAIYNLATGSANLIGAFTETMLNFESIYAGGGNDTITGTSGINFLVGGAGNDTINGGDGDDIIQGGLGLDTLDGGDGTNDTVDYTTFNGLGFYDLTAGSAALIGAFTETMLNFENIKIGNGGSTTFATTGDNKVTGGAGNDTIYGNAGNDYIIGGAGNDYIYGDAGDDYIQGGLGQDYLDGGAGTNDTVDYTTFGGDGIYNMTTGSALLTGAFTEQMFDFERILTGAGNDTITGTSGNNVIETGAGIDTIDGLGGDDYVYAGSGNDIINGGAGIDTIFGMDGSDAITGGDGNDDIYGGAGNDTITGSAGDDEFFFYGGELSATNTLTNVMGTDTITDFTKGEDKIVLDLSTFTNATNINGLNFGVVANDTLAASSQYNIVYSTDTKTLFYNPVVTPANSINNVGFEYGGAFAIVNGLASGVNIQSSDFG